MSQTNVSYKLLSPLAKLPNYQTAGAAGFDFYSANEKPIAIQPGQVVAIPTGLSVEIPHGYEIQVRSRSGLALKNQIVVLNSPGTIDSDYRGEIKIILANFSNDVFIIEPGMRVAQGVLAPVTQARFVEEDLTETERKSGGFGSTGV